jgi:hypothetical protein
VRDEVCNLPCRRGPEPSSSEERTIGGRCSVQCPIFGPVALAPSDTNLNRTVDPQCGHFARTVSWSSNSYWLCLSHMSWKHLGQLRTCVAIAFLVH